MRYHGNFHMGHSCRMWVKIWTSEPQSHVGYLFRKDPSDACRRQIVQISSAVCLTGPIACLEACNQEAFLTTVGWTQLVTIYGKFHILLNQSFIFREGGGEQ